MAVDFLDNWPGWSISFDYRARQELSRHASGLTRSKDLGDPIWFGAWVSPQLRPNEIDAWRAILTDLEHRQDTFNAYAMSRCRPIKHPAGGAAVPTGMKIGTIGGDNRSFTISSANGLTLVQGDMIQVGTAALYRVTKGSTNGGSITVGPQLWPGTAVNDAISVIKPSCLMIVDPGSVQATSAVNGRGTVSFNGIEARG